MKSGTRLNNSVVRVWRQPYFDKLNFKCCKWESGPSDSEKS